MVRSQPAARQHAAPLKPFELLTFSLFFGSPGNLPSRQNKPVRGMQNPCCARRKSYPTILVMLPSQSWQAGNAVLRLDGTRERRIVQDRCVPHSQAYLAVRSGAAFGGQSPEADFISFRALSQSNTIAPSRFTKRELLCFIEISDQTDRLLLANCGQNSSPSAPGGTCRFFAPCEGQQFPQRFVVQATFHDHRVLNSQFDVVFYLEVFGGIRVRSGNAHQIGAIPDFCFDRTRLAGLIAFASLFSARYRCRRIVQPELLAAFEGGSSNERRESRSSAFVSKQIPVWRSL